MLSDLDENGWVDPTAGGGEVVQVDHYYPFGMRMSGTSPALATAAVPNDFLYNGKEYQDELGLGWSDYGARMYDASVGRWNGVDALAELYQPITTYGYTFNNPIRFIDPDGRSVYDPMAGYAPEFQLNRERKEGLFDWAPESYFNHLAQGGPGDGQKKHADGNVGHADDQALDEVVITSDNVDSSFGSVGENGFPIIRIYSDSDGQILEPLGPIAAPIYALIGPRTWTDDITGISYQINSFGYVERPLLMEPIAGEVPIGPGGAFKSLKALKNIGIPGRGKNIRVIEGGVREAVKLWQSITRSAKVTKIPNRPNVRLAEFKDGSKWFFRLYDKSNRDCP